MQTDINFYSLTAAILTKTVEAAENNTIIDLKMYREKWEKLHKVVKYSYCFMTFNTFILGLFYECVHTWTERDYLQLVNEKVFVRLTSKKT